MIDIIIYIYTWIAFISFIILVIKYQNEISKAALLAFGIVSIFWILSMPIKLSIMTYSSLIKLFRKWFPQEPYKDPWEEALTDYRQDPSYRTMSMDIGLDRPKKIKHFKFGR